MIRRVEKRAIYIFMCLLLSMVACKPVVQNAAIVSGEIWPDEQGVHINAHGGGFLEEDGTYFWFGEYKVSGEEGNLAQYGVSCYSSTDLKNWKFNGIALAVDTAAESEITKGSIIERPKVIFNKATGKYVMWFHLEIKGEGYGSARTGVAVSDAICGPYKYLKSYRPNAGVWPQNMPVANRAITYPSEFKWWDKAFYKMVNDGLFVSRDFEKGQMSRDMTVFVDDDGSAYHICSSEENLTLHVSKLTDDYLDFSGEWRRVFPGGHNEAPAVFKRKGKYYMITSGCTGWEPNAARLAVADSIMGEWRSLGNPCVGENADKTFFSQSTFVLPLADTEDGFIFMADRWRPRNPIDGRYVWLPIQFKNDTPYIEFVPKWDMNFFKNETLN